jgi:hypothetical protein
MMSVADPAARHFPTGRHGGSAICGTATFGIAHETICAWADTRLAGILYSVNEGKTAPALASLTRTFRNRLE